MINLIVVILSLISTSALYVFNVLSFSSIASYFLPIAIFSGFFIGWEIIYIAYLYITSLFINPHKEYTEVSKYHKFTLFLHNIGCLLGERCAIIIKYY